MDSVAESPISTRRSATDNAFIVSVEDGEHVTESWVSTLWRWWNERVINARLTHYDKEERLTFIAQRFARVLTAFFDERTKVELSGHLLCEQTKQLLRGTDPWAIAMRRKYGQRMTEWISIYTGYMEQHEKTNKQKKLPTQPLLPMKLTVSRSLEFLRKIPQLHIALQDGVDDLLVTNVLDDQLMGCFRGRRDISGAILARIQNLAATITQQIAWSMLIEPGRPRTDLSRFYAEFDVLESFFDKVELSTDELSTGQTYSSTSVQNDINASFVLGGPLLNTFILAQSPRNHTIVDFWKMVWHERSEFIFMLSEASVGPLVECTGGTVIFERFSHTHCPFFWPRLEDDELNFGCLHVRNAGIDMATDPLFTIFNLDIWMTTVESCQQGVTAKLRLQLWQWNWRNYTDFYWPFRLLFRSRNSKRPTILVCNDGCGKSGTLALIEIFLMQLIRGSVSVEYPMLTAGVFLRLQRRHAVANSMQWLFAYRTVLHWLQPFVISWYHRFVLGFTFPSHGFCAKYEEIAHTYAHRKNLSI
uniref:Tyrosine-protein phosphatase domain-containing protein n=1 Tax=Meloidogyne incognita TaxID=6306 RepID=A0A914KXD5_MELIC